MIIIPSPELVRIDLLHEDGDNPNRMSKAQKDALIENLKRYGFIIPIITNRDYLVADGAQRLDAARSLGMTEVPVIRLDVSDVDRRILRQVLNKLKGEHDDKLDDEEFKRLIDAGAIQDLQLLIGESDKKLVQFFASMTKPGLNDDSLDVDQAFNSPAYDVKEGDLWELGDHLLYCGDSTKPESYAVILGEAKADMVFTDPPYNVNYGASNHPTWGKKWNGEGKGAIANDALSPEDWRVFVGSWMKATLERAKGAVYVCMSCQEWANVMQSFLDNGGHWSSTIIWVKDRFVLSRKDYHTQLEPILHGFPSDSEGEPILYGWPEGEKHVWNGGRKQSDVWFIPRGGVNELHPTMKPVVLVERAIANSSAPGAQIMDPFGGSGTTLVACERLGRKARLIEISPRYCSVIIQRWESLTGKKAIRTNVNETTGAVAP